MLSSEASSNDSLRPFFHHTKIPSNDTPESRTMIYGGVMRRIERNTVVSGLK